MLTVDRVADELRVTINVEHRFVPIDGTWVEKGVVTSVVRTKEPDLTSRMQMKQSYLAIDSLDKSLYVGTGLRPTVRPNFGGSIRVLRDKEIGGLWCDTIRHYCNGDRWLKGKGRKPLSSNNRIQYHKSLDLSNVLTACAIRNSLFNNASSYCTTSRCFHNNWYRMIQISSSKSDRIGNSPKIQCRRKITTSAKNWTLSTFLIRS